MKLFLGKRKTERFHASPACSYPGTCFLPILAPRETCERPARAAAQTKFCHSYHHRSSRFRRPCPAGPRTARGDCSPAGLRPHLAGSVLPVTARTRRRRCLRARLPAAPQSPAPPPPAPPRPAFLTAITPALPTPTRPSAGRAAVTNGRARDARTRPERPAPEAPRPEPRAGSPRLAPGGLSPGPAEHSPDPPAGGGGAAAAGPPLTGLSATGPGATKLRRSLARSPAGPPGLSRAQPRAAGPRSGAAHQASLSAAHRAASLSSAGVRSAPACGGRPSRLRRALHRPPQRPPGVVVSQRLRTDSP